MKEQLTFNFGNHLLPEDVRFTSDELEKIDNGAKEMAKSANSTLRKSSLKALKKSWEDDSIREYRAAESMCAFCLKSMPESTDGYSSIKEALTKSKLLEKAASLLDSTKSKSESVSLDRLPGETESEHRARLRAYLGETE